MNKKLIIAATLAVCAFAAFARPHGGPGPRGGFGGPRPGPAIHHHGGFHHHGGGVWGRGGRNFWPGFVGGVIGGALTSSTVVYPTTTVVSAPVVTAPVVATPVVTTPVVTTPVYTTQQVWVPGEYVNQVQPNGAVVRVWIPGRWEYR